MKFITYEDAGREVPGIMDGSGAGVHPLSAAGLGHATLLAFIQAHRKADLDALRALEKTPGRPLAEVRLLAPIPRPHHDVICVGLNYRDHVAESAAMHIKGARDEAPKAATYFSKRVLVAAGQNADIKAPFHLEGRVDYEAELGVVMGKTAQAVGREEAWEHVFGLCCFNDLTGRDLQDRHGQWFYGKSLDGLTAFGPCIVSRDEFAWPLALRVESRVNGEKRQHSNTANMIYPIDVIISELSQGITLDAGSLIATGTPSGVGAGFTPPRCLQAGDVVEIEVQGVGVLRNTIVG